MEIFVQQVLVNTLFYFIIKCILYIIMYLTKQIKFWTFLSCGLMNLLIKGSSITYNSDKVIINSIYIYIYVIKNLKMQYCSTRNCNLYLSFLIFFDFISRLNIYISTMYLLLHYKILTEISITEKESC